MKIGISWEPWRTKLAAAALQLLLPIERDIGEQALMGNGEMEISLEGEGLVRDT